jgi:hypothetical protein
MSPVSTTVIACSVLSCSPQYLYIQRLANSWPPRCYPVCYTTPGGVEMEVLGLVIVGHKKGEGKVIYTCSLFLHLSQPLPSIGWSQLSTALAFVVLVVARPCRVVIQRYTTLLHLPCMSHLFCMVLYIQRHATCAAVVLLVQSQYCTLVQLCTVCRALQVRGACGRPVHHPGVSHDSDMWFCCPSATDGGVTIVQWDPFCQLGSRNGRKSVGGIIPLLQCFRCCRCYTWPVGSPPLLQYSHGELHTGHSRTGRHCKATPLDADMWCCRLCHCRACVTSGNPVGSLLMWGEMCCRCQYIAPLLCFCCCCCYTWPVGSPPLQQISHGCCVLLLLPLCEWTCCPWYSANNENGC